MGEESSCVAGHVLADVGATSAAGT